MFVINCLTNDYSDPVLMSTFCYPVSCSSDVNTMPSLPISVLAADGGMCACIEAVLIRRYPVQFLETLASGLYT